MVDRNKELAINTVILGIGQLIPKFLAIVLLPLLTSYLTTEEYGNYDLILSIASLLIPVVTMQIQQAVFRYLLASKSAENKTLYVTGSLVYIGISSVVCYPIVYLILRLFKIDSLSAVLICLLFLSEALYSLLGQIVRGLGYNAKYSVSVVVYSAVNLAATAVILMGVAGEVGFANMESTDGNSTYRNRIIDAIYNMDANQLCSMARYEIR